jgi:predicted nicotinamide N-methyase
MGVDASEFIEITADDVDDHVFELYTDRMPDSNQNLGYIDRSSNEISIDFSDGRELMITQSMHALGSTKETSSTGFICWKSSVYFVNWILLVNCPITVNSSIVLEFGAGVGGILATVLAPLTSHYIATDQKHILKLLKHNVVENIGPTNMTSTTVDVQGSKLHKKLQESRSIDVIEFDWEYLRFSQDNYSQLMDSTMPDLIVACDTIYNEYLVPFFVEALKAMLLPTSGAIVVAQLRNPDVIQYFVEQALHNDLKLFYIPESALSSELARGYVVYYIKTKGHENNN